MILSDRNWNIYSTILLIQAFHSLKAWFLWWLPDTSAAIVFALINIIYMLLSPFWQFGDARRRGIAAIILFFFLYRTEGNMMAYAFSAVTSFSLIPLVFLKPEYQIDLLKRFQKVITIILSVSLFFWIWHLIGYDLPSSIITFGTVDRGNGMEDQYIFSNHYLYLASMSWMMRSGVVPEFFRFSAVFLEPGYLAILMVFLLFINGFDFKEKRNILYVGVIIATVSLAGFLMGIFAYIAQNVRSSKRGIYSLFIVTIICFYGYDFFKDYNNGNNFVNQGIIERLEYDEMEGTIAGNNRTSIGLDNHFEEFVKTSDIWYGLGRSKDIEFGVGYKAFLLKYGIFGLAIWLIYMLMISRIGNNYRSYTLLALYILMFLRGDVTMLWYGFMLVYVCGVVFTKYGLSAYEENSDSVTV